MKTPTYIVLIAWLTIAMLLTACDVFGQADSIIIEDKKEETDTIKPKPRVEDLIEIGIRVFNIDTSSKSRSRKKVHFSLLPSAAAVPGGGAAVVTTLNAAFYLGDRTTTNLSTADFTPVFTTSGKIILSLKSTIWLKNNQASIFTENRYVKYPDYTWGLGGNSPEDNRSILNFEYLRFYESILKKIAGNTLAGIGYRFDRYYNISEELEDSTKKPNLENYPYGTDESSKSSGLTMQLLYDTRRNSINPENGKYLSVVYRINPEMLGSDHYWHSIYADGRIYLPLNSDKRKLLAFRSYYWNILGGNVPYLDLPANGWDFAALARGIRRGRYRSNTLLYGESELRFDISANGFWGGVVFASCLGVSAPDTHMPGYFHPAAGLGVRAKFNKYSGSNVALDIGFSKNFFGFYINLGEAF